MIVGVISDTHGLLRPEAVAGLAGARHILHAGDIGSAEVLAGLQAIAPTTAIRGNVDRGNWAAALPDTRTVRLAGLSVYLIHNVAALAIDPKAAGIAVVVSGHSHKPKIATVDGVLYVNPGSAGPRRFTLPVAVAILEVADGGVAARIVEIAP